MCDELQTHLPEDRFCLHFGCSVEKTMETSKKACEERMNVFDIFTRTETVVQAWETLKNITNKIITKQ